MNRRKLPILGIGTLLVVAFLAACSQSPGAVGGNSANNAATAQRVTAEQGTIESHVIATGKVVARANASIVFLHSGVVTSVMVTAGDQVKAGQPLASIDDTDLKLSLQQQYANYVDAQAAYSETIKGPSEADLQSAQAAVISAQEAYSQALKGGTGAEWQSAQASLASAQAAYQALDEPPSEYDVSDLQAKLLNAEATLKQKQAAYDTAYRRNPAGIGGTTAGLELEQATNDYNAAKAAYDKAFQKPGQKDYESAKAQVASAQAQLAALAPTQEKIANAASTLASAQSKLEALTPSAAALAQAKAKLDSAYAGWQSAEKAVRDATIMAPFDGLITAVNIDVGDMAGSGSAAVELANFTVPQFEVDVDEADLGNVKVGETASVMLQTYPSIRIPAQVEWVASAGTSTGNIITYKVKLALGKAPATGDNADPAILLGMSGTSEIVTVKVDNAVLVPLSALIVDSQTKTYSVDLVKGANVQRVPVKIGLRDSNNAQILEGVNAGDTLVIALTSGSASSAAGPGGMFGQRPDGGGGSGGGN